MSLRASWPLLGAATLSDRTASAEGQPPGAGGLYLHTLERYNGRPHSRRTPTWSRHSVATAEKEVRLRVTAVGDNRI